MKKIIQSPVLVLAMTAQASLAAEGSYVDPKFGTIIT